MIDPQMEIFSEPLRFFGIIPMALISTDIHCEFESHHSLILFCYFWYMCMG